LTIPTWLMFLFLTIASFGPLASLWPRGWIAYYGALLVCWVLISVAAIRRLVREEREAKRKLARRIRQFRAVPVVEAAETDVTAVRNAPADEQRLIIVARDKRDLYDRIRSDRLGHAAVTVITDRRSTDRRRRLEVFIPERRLGERRRYDVGDLLLTQGWAEVALP
jgi:hypothetical protein